MVLTRQAKENVTSHWETRAGSRLASSCFVFFLHMLFLFQLQQWDPLLNSQRIWLDCGKLQSSPCPLAAGGECAPRDGLEVFHHAAEGENKRNWGLCGLVLGGTLLSVSKENKIPGSLPRGSSTSLNHSPQAGWPVVTSACEGNMQALLLGIRESLVALSTCSELWRLPSVACAMTSLPSTASWELLSSLWK